MKKFMMAAVALICMTMTSVALISCGGDDDTSVPVNSKDGKYTSSVLNFTFTTTDETLEVLDVIAEYYDANGHIQNEKLTQSTFTKTIKGGLPAYLGARLLLKVKSGVDVTSAEKVTISFAFEYSAYCENDKGEKSAVAVDGTRRGGTMSLNRLETFASHNSGFVKFGFDYTADGQVVKVGWKELLQS